MKTLSFILVIITIILFAGCYTFDPESTEQPTPTATHEPAIFWAKTYGGTGECPPLDTDSTLTRSVPSPGIISPADIVITTSLDAEDTICIVEETPGVLVTPLIP